MHITAVSSTDLFVATDSGPAQILAVDLADADTGASVTVTAQGVVIGAAPASAHVEVPLPGLSGRPVGSTVDVDVTAGDATERATVTVSDPGWTVWMIPHFHYDPVWWNTQAAYTATWDELSGPAQEFRQTFQQTGFVLVEAHLATARRDPDYKFVLAEVDYLRPYWDARPQDRGYIRQLLADGRLEIMGGTYNEPNSNLTTAETSARNFVYGDGFQRQLLGGDPHTAWQLDVFGHDPQFPGMAADAGLTSSSWARGPHHQWGPMLNRPGPDAEKGWYDPSVMQFPAEFEWVSPSGRGVLTHYMPAHYSAGWQIDSRTTLADAEQAVYELFTLLKRVAATHNVLLPVGTDWTPPSKWVTDIARDWNTRYASPRFVCGIPREFFAAVRAELDELGRKPAPQTRDMNPIYTGKDVSYIDTKQAQRSAESLLVDAEMFATFAALHGAKYPYAALDKAWRQLVFGAHHDAITGSESDQVYLDLLTSWRDAWDIGTGVLRASLDHLAGQLEAPMSAGTPIAVFNPSARDRRDLVTVPVTDVPASSVEVLGPDGQVVPCVIDNVARAADGTITSADVTFVAEVPGIGHSAGWQVRASSDSSSAWQDEPDQFVIESAEHLIEVDPRRGGCVSRWYDKRADRELLQVGEVGNELVVMQEYSAHPKFHEGPWHLVPTGEVLAHSAQASADSVLRQTSALGTRLIVTGTISGMRYTQRITLWHGLERVDCRTSLDGFDGADNLVRVRWPVDIAGALPVCDVGNAVIGRGFAFPDKDVVDHPWTLDNPAVNWFALSSTARVRVSAGDGAPPRERAVGVAELIAADADSAARLRELAVALAGQGVTATTSIGAGSRYGDLAVDSNLPDVRITIGGPAENAFTAAVLEGADEQYRTELDKQLAENGTARIWVPADRPLREVWQPSADLTGTRTLPVLIVVGDDEVAALAADLDDAVIDVVQLADAATSGEADLDDYTVALLNTGMPSFNVDTSGALVMSILRSCTGWPSGVWINPPRRTAPDGSNFQQQHWTHHYDYALRAGRGDWRSTGLACAGHELNHPLRTATVRGAGELASRHSYLDVRSDTNVIVTAVKAADNPLASGRPAGPVDAITLRLVELRGMTGECSVRSSFGDVALESTDLLERPGGPSGVSGDRVALTPMQVRTVRLPVAGTAGDAPLADDVEPYQPVYARYWLNNTGPAPRGNLPLTVHSEPSLVEATGGAIDVVVRVASDSSIAQDAAVRVIAPEGWTADPDEFAARVPAGGFAEQSVVVTPPAELADGSWWVRVQADTVAGQVEEVTRVLAGSVPERELQVSIDGPGSLARGSEDCIEVRLTSSARSPLSAQLQLISPWHTWELLPTWDTGLVLDAGETRTVRLPVTVPANAAPGTWWALAKVGAAGGLYYTEPVELTVT